MPKATQRTEYSIAAVSRLTGVSCHALRIWERRYGFPVPCRSPSGHRRYPAEQVGLLRQVAQLVKAGRPVHDVMAEARAGGLEEPAAPGGPVEGPAPPGLVDLLVAGDLGGADALLAGLGVRLGVPELVCRVIEPALIDVGERWFRGDLDIFQERNASVYLRHKLSGLLDAARRANARPRHLAVLGTVQGDRHEGGVLIVSLLLELAGWRSMVLGVDLPVREYQRAVEAWRPDALALSFVMSRNINKRFQELARLRGAPVYVGGRSILNYQGLARRHGLVPIVGPATTAVATLLADFERRAAQSPDPPAPAEARPAGK